MKAQVVVERSDGICSIKIARPEKKNALTAEMYTELARAFTEASDSSEIRVVVLFGSEDCFTAGNDLTDFSVNPPTSTDSPVYKFLDALSTCAVPVIAGVAGHAVGIGSTALLHCDMVVAAENATFSFPFTDLGLCPEAGSSVLLTATVGLKKASEYLLFGNKISAHEALSVGLVNEVVETGTVIESIMDRARRLAYKPPDSVRLTKSMIKKPLADLVATTMTSEAHAFVRRLQSPEAKEAFSAFAEKRPPKF